MLCKLQNIVRMLVIIHVLLLRLSPWITGAYSWLMTCRTCPHQSGRPTAWVDGVWEVFHLMGLMGKNPWT